VALIKKYWWVGIIIAVIIIYLYLKSRQTKATEVATKQTYSEADFIAALPKVVTKYGKGIAEYVEKIYRLETAHFKSEQFKATGTPGMEAHGIAPNYGWYAPFFVANPSYTPLGTHVMKENGTGREKTFIVMPSVEAAMMFLADYLKRYDSPGRWYTTVPEKQAQYVATLNTIISRHTNTIA
jgi:hypothetical protein